MTPIDRNQLKRMNELKHDFVLINVLQREDFNIQHIRTSINIPLQESVFVERVEAVAGNKNREIVVYCANADCQASPKAAKQLEQAGFAKVFDYEGGVEDWFAAKEAA